MNLPNRLTILRIVLIPVMVVIALLDIQGEILGIPILYWILNLIFVLASITDWLDGVIARKTNTITTFGKFADPLADKILVLAAMMILVQMAKIPAWIPIIIMAREFIVSGYRLVEVEQGGKVIAASWWGKLKTVTQMFAIIAMFLDVKVFGYFWANSLNGWELFINITSTSLFIAAVIATIFSGWDYLKDSKKLFA
ncbi:MAG: CDP-diacylglycerol--glycerol-3-phosphate 3-phosphatidyltransferase [Oscillospiraceae bacterium]|nr:CDP-diacylglycerol--glycerol-3-phosphate 3-phosphatidyltransferase [Oscillospiraceae bacterium]